MQLGILLLLLVYAYYQKNYYLEADSKRLENNIFIIVLSLLACLVVVFIITLIRNGKRLKNVATGLIKIISLSIPLYFWLNALFLSGTYFLNRLFVRDIVKKPYLIVDVKSGTKQITLYDLQTHNVIWNDCLVVNRSLSNLTERDTVNISFKKGLFGFCFDPRLD